MLGVVEVELIVEVEEEEVVVRVVGNSEDVVGFKVVATSGFMVIVFALQTH